MSESRFPRAPSSARARYRRQFLLLRAPCCLRAEKMAGPGSGTICLHMEPGGPLALQLQ